MQFALCHHVSWSYLDHGVQGSHCDCCHLAIARQSLPHGVDIQYGSATRYKAFAFHTRAKRARNAFEIFVNAFHSRFLRVSSPFAPRSISGY